MTPATDPRLRTYAEVIVRTGLNLQPGQRLLIAEPFELQGVSRAAAPLVEACAAAAAAAGAASVEVLWGSEDNLRRAAGSFWTDRSFAAHLAACTGRLQQAITAGDALLFLEGAHPGLTAGLPPRRVARLRIRCWEHYGRIAPDLLAGRTNWTAAPAPTPDWARAVYPGAAPAAALARLWEAVFSACRADQHDPAAAWREHVARLRELRDSLNARRPGGVHFRGPGTDLRVALPRACRWCAGELHTPAGLAFVPNLPTEEVFTAPSPAGTEGTLRVACPVSYGGTAIEGIELVFREGRVVASQASAGADLLRCLLRTDAGASRLGEVALVAHNAPLAWAGPLFFHPLLDENTRNHVALGDAYGFTTGAGQAANSSALHVDLPLDAAAELV